MNDWKRIWQNHSANENILKSQDFQKVLLELKRSNGYDVIGEGLECSAFIELDEHLLEKMSCNNKGNIKKQINSVYEVGCGSGANLYVLERKGIKCGGIDYSSSLLNNAAEVLLSEDLTCDDALSIPVTPQYDAILSNGVFSYFDNEDYTWNVLEKMYNKTNFSIALTELHDIEKKDAFIKFRRSAIKDYDERYKNLPKLFYSKEFFEKFAKEHNMDIEIEKYDVPGYWNNDFCFFCYMYKR